METKTIRFYSESELKKLKRGLWIARIAAIMLALITLAVCIWFCVNVNTANALSQLVKTMIVSALGGWAVITLRITAIKHYKYAAAHCEAILKGEEERTEGRFAVSDTVTRIYRGVSFYRVRVNDEAESNMSIYSRYRKRFDESRAAAVYTVYGFITAYEVAV